MSAPQTEPCEMFPSVHPFGTGSIAFYPYIDVYKYSSMWLPDELRLYSGRRYLHIICL